MRINPDLSPHPGTGEPAYPIIPECRSLAQYCVEDRHLQTVARCSNLAQVNRSTHLPGCCLPSSVGSGNRRTCRNPYRRRDPLLSRRPARVRARGLIANRGKGRSRDRETLRTSGCLQVADLRFTSASCQERAFVSFGLEALVISRRLSKAKSRSAAATGEMLSCLLSGWVTRGLYRARPQRRRHRLQAGSGG